MSHVRGLARSSVWRVGDNSGAGRVARAEAMQITPLNDEPSGLEESSSGLEWSN
jgi:hypothetical protein